MNTKFKLIFKRVSLFVLVCIFFSLNNAVGQSLENFIDGPAIKGFGKHATVEGASVNENTTLKVAFDVGKAAEGGEVNRRFDSLARFINMHVAAGVPIENIALALVVHGRASLDLLDNPTYKNVHEKDNPNKALIQALIANNVRVILCGQTAAAYEISASQLIEGSEVELSAMTAHALLQQQGYTLNPF
ncbi:DsrE family protein [Ningiella sp. W23]|uniref:DsrE family protein n=1 Tax=Ningiella sp. W23 TaxID=3023715 RepID=UPI00375713E2